MNKKIFIISFCSILLVSFSAKSDVTFLPNVGNIADNKVKEAPNKPYDVEGLPNPNNEEEVKNFFKKRLENAYTTEITKDMDLSQISSHNVVPSPETLAKQAEEKKSTFQKIYEEALRSIKKGSTGTSSSSEGLPTTENIETPSSTRFFTLAPQNNPEVVNREPEIATVAVTLPSGKRILTPAIEHIPYWLSYIDILSNGYIKIEDTITIVANGEKFATGLERMFPKYTTYKGKRQHRIEFILNSVTVNGTTVPYYAEEVGDNIVIKPKYNQQLTPGVYTYKFEYYINNKLQKEENLVFLDWHLTGRPINALITSANSIIALPNGFSFADKMAVIGKDGKYTEQRTNIFNLAQNVVAFSNTTPLLNGENMQIITVTDNTPFIKDYDNKFENFIIDWGNVLYASIGFITILLSFLLSLFSLKKERKKNKFNPTYNGSIMRNISIGKYDRIAFISQLLELHKKEALDITNDNNRIYLIRKDISSKRLSKIEKRALKKLFPKKETRLEINISNNQHIKKAKNIFEKANKKLIKKFRLMHNIGYVIFSIAMLITSEIFIALININFAQSLTIMLSTNVLFAFYIWILRHNFKRLYVSLPIKLFSIIAIFIVWLFSSIYIGGITSALITGMIALIFGFSRIFNEQNNFVNDAKNTISNYKEYLEANAEVINLSKDFLNQQSNIFALGITDYYPQNVSNKRYYMLDIADALKQSLIGII